MLDNLLSYQYIFSIKIIVLNIYYISLKQFIEMYNKKNLYYTFYDKIDIKG